MNRDFKNIKKKLLEYSELDIESGVMDYVLSEYGYPLTMKDNKKINEIKIILKENDISTNLEEIIELFEVLYEESKKEERGIIFTPKYIADYIVEESLSEVYEINEPISIVDPSCGCGVFLVSAIEYLHNKTGKSVNEIMEYVYGIDIEVESVRRCKLLLMLLCAKYGEKIKSSENIVCADSLKDDWKEKLGVNKIDYVIGNPPYVNPHGINEEYAKYIKQSFETTKSGTFNLYYAFIEKSISYISENGNVAFILPNNFLTIKSATYLRKMLQDGGFISLIIDFGENMIFKPVRTYNCIMRIDKNCKSKFNYAIVGKTDNIGEELKKIKTKTLWTTSLDENGWKLVDIDTLTNIKKIESSGIQIKSFIRTGIATLKDSAYFVNKDENGYYKEINGEKIYMEDGLIKPIYKIPELKNHALSDEVKRYIIFPYTKENEGYKLINEEIFREKYPLTYRCLLVQRNKLDERDKGHGIAQGWYAYGRSQGLNKYGKKILFPTFSSKPKFIMIRDDDALFCNGYAVFENESVELDILEKILNSEVMDYYVKNTSYSIEGGYYCYQKKYIERFSIPYLTNEEQKIVRNVSKDELNVFLKKKYGIA